MSLTASENDLLATITRALEESRDQVLLPANWDDEGAQPVAEATFERASRLLLSTARVLHRRYGVSLPLPNINPCSDGSIDLYWKTPGFKLLVNVQPNDASESDFYGENEQGLTLKGRFRPETQDLEFLSWLFIAG